MKALVETVQQLSLARDLNTIMDVVRHAARQLTGADGATFVLKDNDQCYYAEEDAISPLWKGQRFPLTSCISGWAMINRKAAVIEDIYVDPRIPHDAYRATFVKSLAMVPIRTMNPIGAIGNYWAEPHMPTRSEVFLLQSLADITSVSIENVYMYEEMRTQNKQLADVAFLQSHQLRAPVANIQGLFNLFDFDDLSAPRNIELLRRLKSVADSLDRAIEEVVIQAREIRKE